MLFYAKNNSIFFIVCVILFSSCISTKKVLNQIPLESSPFSFEVFNGNYYNKSSVDSSATSLWETLYECKTLKKDLTKITKKTLVNLRFDDIETLVVEAVADGIVSNTIKLKGKMINGHFSIKRKMLFVPLPFIYFRHRERKVLLGISKNNSLIVKRGVEEFLWIFIMSGGYYGLTSKEYKKHTSNQ